MVKPTGYGYAQYYLMPPRSKEDRQELRERIDAKVDASIQAAALKLIKSTLENVKEQRINIRA